MGSKESIPMSYSTKKLQIGKMNLEEGDLNNIKMIETELFFTVNNGL